MISVVFTLRAWANIVILLPSVDLTDKSPNEQFIGRWIEGESSFLFFSEPSREKIDDLLRNRADLSLLQEHLFSYEEWRDYLGVDACDIGRQ